MLFAILQKYDFSSKSQLGVVQWFKLVSCLRYCKSTIFQANHNPTSRSSKRNSVVCDTAKVRFFKQITTQVRKWVVIVGLFAILQKYDFSSKSQLYLQEKFYRYGCLRYCKSTIFQANHNGGRTWKRTSPLFAILQKYDFSSKSQRPIWCITLQKVVCDTAKVRFFKQITTGYGCCAWFLWLFAILQKYDFSSKSQLPSNNDELAHCCLRYCKSTIFQANHNSKSRIKKVISLFAILQKYDFSSKSQPSRQS